MDITGLRLRNNLTLIIEKFLRFKVDETLAKVADINFTYDYGDLIKLLKNRGQAIKKKDDKKEMEANKKIEKLI